MTPNAKGGIAQSDRARLRALAQKRRVTRAERREIMLELVVAGYERELIAQKLCVSLATVRREVDKAIDQRALDAPDRYVRLQVTRLTRALRVVDDALQRCDLKAVEPLVKIVGLLDRYHGLAAASATNRQAVEPRRLSRAVAPLALTHAAPGLELSRAAAGRVAEPIVDSFEPRRFGRGIAAREAARRSRPEMAPQRLEKIESAPGNGMGSEASNLQHLVPGRAADRATPADEPRE
jgi:hypothetical protein